MRRLIKYLLIPPLLLAALIGTASIGVCMALSVILARVDR